MSTPRTSPVLDAILQGMQIWNTFKPILDGAFKNEADRLGLSRSERKALTDRLTTETDQITDEDMGDQP